MTIARAEKPAKEVVLTIWDNLAMHAARLEKLGATPAELAELRAAAQAVHDAEEAEARTAAPTQEAAKVLQPVTVLGWLINPPTTAARYYARCALRGVMEGGDGGPALALHALVAGLFALHMYTTGRKGDAMAFALSPATMADWLADIMPRLGDAPELPLSQTWCELMGIDPSAEAQKKTTATARAAYRLAVDRLQKTLASGPRGSPHA